MRDGSRRTTLPIREVGTRKLEDYAKVAGRAAVGEIRQLALDLKGKSVLHVNSSPSGGGVADIFEALIPLLNDVDVGAEWRTIKGEAPFFDVTKSMHNSLQGKRITWTDEMWDTWLEYNRRNADELFPDYDIVFVHDPQPAPLLGLLKGRRGECTKWNLALSHRPYRCPARRMGKPPGVHQPVRCGGIQHGAIHHRWV